MFYIAQKIPTNFVKVLGKNVYYSPAAAVLGKPYNSKASEKAGAPIFGVAFSLQEIK